MKMLQFHVKGKTEIKLGLGGTGTGTGRVLCHLHTSQTFHMKRCIMKTMTLKKTLYMTHCSSVRKRPIQGYPYRNILTFCIRVCSAVQVSGQQKVISTCAT